MKSYCDIYMIKNGDIVHKIVELDNIVDQYKLEKILYNDSFKNNNIYLAVFMGEIDNKLLATKVDAILPPRMSSINKAKTNTVIERILKIDALAEKARYYVLNFKDELDNWDLEYLELKTSELDSLKPIIDVYFDEKTGRLTPEEENILKEFRTYNLAKFVFEEETPTPISNHNLGTVVVTPDNVYEMAETHDYHKTTAAITLAKHYRDSSYMNLDINEMIAKGNIIIVLKYLTVLVYRPPFLTSFQSNYLNILKKQIIDLKRDYAEEVTSSLGTGALVYTGKDIYGVMDFLEEENATKPLTNEEIEEVMRSTEEIYYEPVTKESGIKR